MKTTFSVSATRAFLDKGVADVEGDRAMIDSLNRKITSINQGQWGATAGGWAQTAVIRKSAKDSRP